MKDKLTVLATLYIMPIVLTCFIPLVKDVQVNGESLGLIGSMAAAFATGMAIEGFVIICMITVGVLTGKINQ